MRNEKVLIWLLAGVAVLLAAIIVMVLLLAVRPLTPATSAGIPPSTPTTTAPMFAPSTATASPTTTAPTSAPSTAPNDGSVSTTDASATVLQFFNAYLSGAGSRSGAQQVVQQYGTSKFQAAWQAQSNPDPVLCASSWSGNTFSVVNTTASGGVATITVNNQPSSGNALSTRVTAVSQAGQIKIDAVTCPNQGG